MPRDGTSDEPDDGDDNDTGRRRALIALLAVVGLAAVSLYVGHVLEKSAALEDCEMQGRTNCAPIAPGGN